MKSLIKRGKSNLAVFASGTGSNFINIYNHISEGKILGNLNLLISNNSNSRAILFAKKNHINYKIINQSRFSKNIVDVMLKTLNDNNIDLIILAGYMKKIPKEVIAIYPNKILNIHPALLPKFGGQGFYGMNVHKAVIDSGDENTGITIHFVDDSYDTGNIIYQEKINVIDGESPENLSRRVLELEHKNYPKIINDFCKKIRR